MGCTSCGTTPSGCQNKGTCSSGGCSMMHVYDWLSDIAIAPLDAFNIYEVSFKNGARKGFFINTENIDIYTGDRVVVEATIGYDIGIVSLSGELVKVQMKKRKVKETDEYLRILRIANDRELELIDEARSREKETMLKARIMARSLGLDMKLGDVEFQADCKKATFYYTANHRVDFRELIKELAKEFKVKIEMRQIGARQEAGRVGGIGSCGRELCCSTWLTNFKSVNTSAARYQNLSINQTKLSGQCGRLKCCLNYELDTYLDALKDFPEKADYLETEAGNAKLIKTDILKGLMIYVYPKSGTFYPIPIDKVKEILEMNKLGKKPNDLLEVAQVQEKPDTIEYVDLVGQVSLKSLEKTEKRTKKKKKASNPTNVATKETPVSKDTAVKKGPAPKASTEPTPSANPEAPAPKKKSNFKRRKPNPNQNNKGPEQ
ncbi:MAG TPA: regulatory iron-sulfur-containing complex subunit RicT [Chitinophagales bacterium]|nr:regulatory iron-sulfur-containing complex subunit RicT [Chitinophagales bacterium]